MTNGEKYDIIIPIMDRGAFCHQYFVFQRLSEAGRKKGADAEVGLRNKAVLATGNKIPAVVAEMRSAIKTTE